MEIKPMNETETKTALITPALEKSGWKILVNMRQEYYFTDGQIIIHGGVEQRGSKKYVDYALLDTNNRIIAIVEAKDFNNVLGTGLQQAKEYGNSLKASFVYSSNGQKFKEYDFITGKEREIDLDKFPTQAELMARIATELKSHKNFSDDVLDIVNTPYYWEEGYKEPRYYQRNVIDNVVESVARGQKRVMFVMATGTGKTFTAFQIVWRLLKAGKVAKVLYLADRNILIDQTMKQDFKPLADVMTKFKSKKADSAFKVYMALYQQLVSYKPDTKQPYESFAKDFFDLIVIDECHRGSVNENSEWHKILDYFDSAIHIGMTATPKSEDGADDFKYFGNPVYTYSLRQGIEDGFLAPYRVTHSNINIDESGYKPESGEIDNNGNALPDDKVFQRKDFERNIALINRQNVVAKRILKMLHHLGPMTKTIVFCQDQQHADDLRTRLINQNAEINGPQHYKYIMRITSDDTEGKKALDDFITASSPMPVIVTTSELLTTGVDCKTCALIVLDKEVNNITTFKQIVGRGTRIYERGKTIKRHFDILDFRNATRWLTDENFDKDFDPDPLPSEEVPGVNDPATQNEVIGSVNTLHTANEESSEFNSTSSETTAPDTEATANNADDSADNTTQQYSTTYGTGSPVAGAIFTPDAPTTKVRYVVDGGEVFVTNEMVQVYDSDGILITESITSYSRRKILELYPTIEEFKLAWSKEKKQTIVDYLKVKAVVIEAIRNANPEFAQSDIFDIICNVAFDKKPITRKQRAKKVYDMNYFSKFDSREKAKEILELLLEKYAERGVLQLENMDTLKASPFAEKFGKISNIIKLIGGKDEYNNTINEIESILYA